MFSSLSKGSSSTFGKIVLAVIFHCFCVPEVFSQNYPAEENCFVYKQEVEPVGIDIYQFSAYYYNGKHVYNLLGERIASIPKNIESLSINPSGNSYAVLVTKGKKSKVFLYDLWKDDLRLEKFNKIKNPTAVYYTSDSKHLLIADDEYMYFYNDKGSKLLDKMPLSFKVTDIEVSPDSRYLAASDGSKLIVWSYESRTVLKEFSPGVNINDFSFADDGKTLAILTDDGTLSLYDIYSFFNFQSFDALGDAKDCSFHPDGKHFSVVTSDNRIAIVNLENEYDRDFINTETEGISQAQFVTDGNYHVYLCYNTKESIVYECMDEILPQGKYQLYSNELSDRMDDWMKMKPGETLEEYNLRMSEDNKMRQMRLFEQEIATRLAENFVQTSEVSFGSYSPEKEMLALNFDNMPSIYLDVPSEDVNDFMDPGSLEIYNEKYIMDQDENFQLTYAEVYNSASGKKYIFDNQERMSLDFLKSDEDFIPLNFVQQSNMEEIKLQAIKDNIVTSAIQNNIISDHTNISVNAKIVPSTDADGNRINNYNIKFSYEVESGFSVHEDFAPGKYKVEDSGAAKSMLSIIKTALETEFAQYFKEGKKLNIVVTGMADALQINNKIAYDGTYGDFTNEPVYRNDELNSITVTESTGITQNEQLAFLRAVGVKEYIRRNVGNLDKMDVDYRFNIELTSGTGGEFRRITVEFIFVDAFMQ